VLPDLTDGLLHRLKASVTSPLLIRSRIGLRINIVYLA
jgi:hypothetical protein